MTAQAEFAGFALLLLFACPGFGQTSPPSPPAAPSAAATAWSFNFTLDGYLIPNQTGYPDPDFSANRGWLHLEARYNNEDYRTGSTWIGYNFAAGKKLVLNVTPMVGGVFGRTNGFAPGCEASLTYKKIALSINNYYLFDTSDHAGNYYYSWPQLTFSPTSWFHTGLVAQRSKILHTALDTQRGFLVGFSRGPYEFTTYIFNAGWTQPTVVLEVGANF